jgi:putative proteasome-type protease
MRLHEGLVFLADTRTNAGVDNVGTYRKQHIFQPSADRTFVLQSAGNLATTQEVLDRLRRDLDQPADHDSLATVHYLFEAALYIGRVLRAVIEEHREALHGADPTATFILGGQVEGDAADILMVYPEGNYIRASDDLPFLQIGETKYGKFLLEMAATLDVDTATAVKIAISSMMSTARANVAVGPPYDLALYIKDMHALETQRIGEDSQSLRALSHAWERMLRSSVAQLPSFLPADLPQLDAWIAENLPAG